jgi:hypothetical protein
MSVHSLRGVPPLALRRLPVDYKVDLRDIKFQLFEWLKLGEMLEAEKYADWDTENVEMVLDEALKIAQEQMAACNEDGDRIGAQYEDGKVTLPESFKPVFQTICEGGWIGLLASPEFGGMGLPDTVGLAVNEFFNGSNVSLSLTRKALLRGVDGYDVSDRGPGRVRRRCVDDQGDQAGRRLVRHHR